MTLLDQIITIILASCALGALVSLTVSLWLRHLYGSELINLVSEALKEARETRHD